MTVSGVPDDVTAVQLLRAWITMELAGDHDAMCGEVSRTAAYGNTRDAMRNRSVIIAAVGALAHTWGTLEDFSAAMIEADWNELP